MSANLRQFTKTVYGFDHVIRTIKADQWSKPSPCEGWTAADVAEHATGVLQMIQKGATGSDAPASPDDRHAAWVQARDGVLEALDHPGVLQKVVPSPFGEMPIDNLIGVLMVDTLTHTWDLARAAGGDEALDSGLVVAADAAIRPMGGGIRGPGMFAAAIEESDTDSVQDRFLKFLGRMP